MVFYVRLPPNYSYWVRQIFYSVACPSFVAWKLWEVDTKLYFKNKNILQSTNLTSYIIPTL